MMPAFWYMPTYTTGSKTLAHVQGHIQWFYRNCWTLYNQHKPILNQYLTDMADTL